MHPPAVTYGSQRRLHGVPEARHGCSKAHPDGFTFRLVIRERSPESPWTIPEYDRARSASILRRLHPNCARFFQAPCRLPSRRFLPFFGA